MAAMIRPTLLLLRTPFAPWPARMPMLMASPLLLSMGMRRTPATHR